MAITVGGMASLVPSQGVLRVGDKVMAKTYDAIAAEAAWKRASRAWLPH